jgi:hypothetical protein
MKLVSLSSGGFLHPIQPTALLVCCCFIYSIQITNGNSQSADRTVVVHYTEKHTHTHTHMHTHKHPRITHTHTHTHTRTQTPHIQAHTHSHTHTPHTHTNTQTTMLREKITLLTRRHTCKRTVTTIHMHFFNTIGLGRRCITHAQHLFVFWTLSIV